MEDKLIECHERLRNAHQRLAVIDFWQWFDRMEGSDIDRLRGQQAIVQYVFHAIAAGQIPNVKFTY